MRLGIVSTADINRKVIPGAHASDKIELVAVASREQRRAEEYAKTWEIPRAYGSYESLLEDPDVDAVYISLPNTHASRMVDPIARGREARDLREALQPPTRGSRGGLRRGGARGPAADGGVHVPPQPADGARCVELVRGGAIGELRLVRSAFSYSFYDADNIRLRTDVDGGSLMDVGCYCVSGSRLLAGEPESVHGQAYVGPTGTDWVFTGSLRFPGDVLALFDCGTSLADRDELEAVGSEGSLFLDDPWHCKQPVLEIRRADGVERVELDPVDSYRLELENLADAAAGEAPLRLGREDALGQARTIDALFRSAESGASVSPT